MHTRLGPGSIVRIRKPEPTEPTAPLWAGEMDAYDGLIMRVRTIELGSTVTLEGAVALGYWLFHEDWLTLIDPDTFAGFCDACAGFRRHRLGCPLVRTHIMDRAGS